MSRVATRAGVVLLVVFGLGMTETGAQTVELKTVMRRKLAESEKLLEAVVTSNWADLALRSRRLEAVTDEPAWMVLKTPEYGRQSSAFIQAARELVEAAERRDQEATPLAYLSLTLSCVRCHQYVARTRMAHATPTGPQ